MRENVGSPRVSSALDQRGGLVLLVVLVDEGTGAGQVAGAAFLRGLRDVPAGQEAELQRRRRLQELRVRSGEGHLGGERIEHRGAGVPRQVARRQRCLGAGEGLDDRVEVLLHRLRGERGAVTECHAVLQPERERRGVPVHLPAFGEPRLQFTGPGVLIGERVDDLTGDVDGLVAAGLRGIGTRGGLGQAVAQGAAGLRGAATGGGARRVGAARGEPTGEDCGGGARDGATSGGRGERNRHRGTP